MTGGLGSHSPATSLDQLLADVNAARQWVSQERDVGAHLTEVTTARAALLGALEAYAAGLAAVGQPLPYKLRDELFLHRQLVGRERPGRTRG